MMILAFYNRHSYGQEVKGLMFNTGLATMNSSHLNSNWGRKNNEDPLVKISDAHSGHGIMVGVGLFLQYKLSDKVSLVSDFTFNYQNSAIYINYLRDSMDVNKNGFRHSISSAGKLRLYYLSVELVTKYKFWDRRRFFLLTGVGCRISAPPIFKSSEMSVYSTYKSGYLISSEVSNQSDKVTINKYNPLSVYVSFGIEKELSKKMKKFMVSINYNLTLTNSPLYSTDPDLYNKSINNKVFSSQGKNESEVNSYAKRLNNYKISAVFFSVKYLINNKKK